MRKLSPRKREIAECIARGLTNRQIAGQLRIKLNTVRSHVRDMAFLFDDPPEISPRTRIMLWIKHEEWSASRARE